MVVYHYDLNGNLTGTSELDDSDKCQISGEWILPGMSTDKKPLKEKKGYIQKFNGTNWEYEKVLTIEERKILGELPLIEGEKIESDKIITIEKPSEDCIWDNELKEWLTVELQKAKGLLPLEEGEKIIDNSVVKIDKPDHYHVWNGTDWEYNSEIRKTEITSELEKLDFETIRPLRTILSGLGTEFEKSKLAEIETKAMALRVELKNLVVE